MIILTIHIAVGSIVQRRRYSARRALTEGEQATLELIVCEAVGTGLDVDEAVLTYLRGLG